MSKAFISQGQRVLNTDPSGPLKFNPRKGRISGSKDFEVKVGASVNSGVTQ
jgi:hypothetical protein